MIKLEEIARPYARAAFEWANAQQQVPQWLKLLQLLAQLCQDDKVRKMLKSPHYDTAQKVSLLVDLAQENLDDKGKNFLNVIAENHRLMAMPAIYEQFVVLQEASVNVLEAEVITAQPLSAKVEKQLIAALERRTLAKIHLHHRLDETLLGGMKIRLGDEIIDGSVLGKLQRLAHHLQLKENVCQ